MAIADSSQTGPETAAGLSLNLSSNNPFRNRAASPALASPASPFDDPPPRPVSRNPFLDAPPAPVRSPGTMSTQSDPKSLTAEDIFASLTLDDKKGNLPSSARRTENAPTASKRSENVPPPQGSSRHRPTPSQEEALRARKPQAGQPRQGPSNSPQRRPQRKPRRNSESSVLEFNSLTAEEKQMIEEKRRERRKAEAKEAAAREARDGKSKEKGEAREGREGREGRSSRPRDKTRPSRRVDIIDQLDATSIYGTGLFHHDGPFDALNPHRNRNGRRAAPMQAFPKDSANMSLGGSGPLNKQPNHATFMGHHDDEAFRDWTSGKKDTNGWVPPKSKTEVPIFDSTARGDLIHGDESVGLGTSTFLEGTPAARTAIVQQAQEEATNGLQRKKSLAQRMRPFNKGSREYGPPGRRIPSMRSPDGTQSAGLGPGGSRDESNPFFSEYSKGEESITVRREGAMSPTSPPVDVRRGSDGGQLERRVTTDGTSGGDMNAPSKPTGILGRMKSLKGGRRQRNPEPQVVAAEEPPSYPGTAV